MTAPSTNVTLPGNRNVLPDAWIGRIFDHMSGLYGSKFSDLWRGSDLNTVRRLWAEKLAGFADMPKAIKEALDALDSKPYPPTLPEFLALCREAGLRKQGDVKKLSYMPTAEEIQRGEEILRQAEMAIRINDCRNHREWVTNLQQRHDKGEKLYPIQLSAVREVAEASE